MNVKIGRDEVRFKITADEQALLQDGRVLSETLAIGRKKLSIAVDPAGVSADMIVVYDADTVRLLISPAQVEKLAAMGRSREGLEQTADGLSVSLQVDFRTQKKRQDS